MDVDRQGIIVGRAQRMLIEMCVLELLFFHVLIADKL